MRKSRTPKGRGRGRRRRRASQGAGATAAVVTEMEGDFSAGDLGFQLGHVTLPPFQGFCSSSTGSPFPFEKLLEAEGDGDDAPLVSAEEGGEDKDCILSQDFFCPIGYRYADHPLSSKSAINSRFRPLTIDFGHWRLISTIGGRLREKEEEGEEEKRENKEIPTLPRFPMRSVAHGSSSVGFLLRSRRRGEKGEGNSPRRNEGTPHLPARGEGRMR
ncbi:hypothetical protein GW17_00006030 [Ensete ventricosum]|nr:hypothetical protein GW17_00006030 [Ensete ventricosum]